MMRSTRKGLLLSLLAWAVLPPMHAAGMRGYSIELPGHVLHFSFPEEIAREMSPWQVEPRFSPTDKAYVRDGFRQLAGHLHDFNGPFWIGAYGSLRINFMVIGKSGKYEGEIVTLDGVERYVRWWAERENAGYFAVRQGTLNGAPAIVRLHDSFGQPATPSERHAERIEIFALPLDGDAFIQVGFGMVEWVPGSAGKWRKKAERLRAAIEATIRLEAKPGASAVFGE